MIEINTVKSLCEAIWKLEQKYNLLDLEIDNIKIWQVYRMGFYYLVSQKLGIFEAPHTISTRADKIKELVSNIKYSIVNNPLVTKVEKKDFIVFEHKRSTLVEGDFIDIYTDHLSEKLYHNDERFYIFEEPFFGKHKNKNFKERRIYLDYIILLSRLLRKFTKVNIEDAKLKFIKQLEDDINTTFNINIDLLKIFLNRAQLFKIKYRLYKSLLKKISPKELFIVVGYMQPEIIKAAKEMQIKVSELQHGTFSKYHLGYSYPNLDESLDYFPDKFMVWNEMWKNFIKLPIDESKVLVHKNKFQEKKIQKYKDIKKIKNQVIVLSQGALTSKIADFVINNYNFFEGKKVIYKLHPGEYSTYKDNQSIMKLSSYDNVDIVTNVDLYKYLAESEYQVGCFSTAIYEGLSFNCKTYLINLPGIEYMQELVDNKLAMVLNEEEL